MSYERKHAARMVSLSEPKEIWELIPIGQGAFFLFSEQFSVRNAL